jgi:branched-chain amino acid transport system ATP-binding protein
MLNVSNLNVKHGELAVVNNVSLQIHTSEIVAVVGGNGAGKTSLARAIVGLSRAHGGSIEITRDKAIERLNGKPTWAIARKGVVYVPETKPVFERLTVEENLTLGFPNAKLGRETRGALLARIYDKFPLFVDRRVQVAGTLSGGQKRMLAIAKALLFMDALDATGSHGSNYFKLLILDEPTHGLHPNAIKTIGELLRQVNHKGLAILIIEQMVPFALSLATRGYLMRHGEVITSGSANELLHNPGLTELYLGASL